MLNNEWMYKKGDNTQLGVRKSVVCGTLMAFIQQLFIQHLLLMWHYTVMVINQYVSPRKNHFTQF